MNPGTSHVFTYGSLMFDAVWSRVVAGRYAALAARVDGLRRHAVRGETYPGAVRAPGASIEGRLYLDVDAADVLRLDAFEGPDYQRVVVPAVTADGATVDAGVYLYLPTDRLLDADWDVEGFARDGIVRFMRAFVDDR